MESRSAKILQESRTLKSDVNTVSLEVGNIHTQIKGLYPRTAIDRATSFHREGYYFDPRFRMGRWDGKIHLLSRDRFPTGLMAIVQQVLTTELYPYTIEDKRTCSEDFGSLQIKDVTLRPYQVRAALTMIKKQRGVVMIPTAGGKTLIAASVIKALNVPTLYVVHTKALLEQTVRVFRKAFKDVGVVGGGEHDWQYVTVGMVQTLKKMVDDKKLDHFKTYQMLITDECHHISSDGRRASWLIVAEQCTEAYYRFGMSATPVTEKHGLLLVGATGPVIFKVPVQELQESGYISESQVLFYKFPKMFVDGDSYLEVYRTGIVYNTLRNEKTCKVAGEWAAKKKLVMVFVDLIEHGEIITSMLSDFFNHLRIEYLSGEADRDRISDVTRKARERGLDILIVTRKLFGEGVDIPAVDVLINAAAGMSEIIFTQMFGRGLRLDPLKENLVYVDFVDDNHPFLSKHSKARIAHCKRLGQPPILLSSEEKYGLFGIGER